MKQRTALLIAAAMTSFLLVAAGGIIASAATAAPDASAGAAVPVTETAQLAAEPQPAATSDLEAQREAEYQALLQQANERIQQANQRITVLTEQLQQAQPPAASPAQAPEYAVSPDLAAAYALQLAPGATLLGAPELVDFQGVAAYEVRLDQGNLYIDATTGRVVYDGVNTAAGGSSERESEHEREQESDHDGDDD